MELRELIKLNDCKFIFNALKGAGGDSRFVGGCVRNALLHEEIKDIDIATTLLPEEVEKIFGSYKKIKLINVGREHGTIVVVLNSQVYEITTLRQDIQTDGRHAVVKYTTDWKADAARRDFTINAMSYSPHEDKLYDYFNGQSDIDRGLIKFVGMPEQRVQEDYLRILRLFRFHTYYGQEIDEASLAACEHYADNLKQISKERKSWELLKIIEHNSYLKTFELMLEQNILACLQLGVDWIGSISQSARLSQLAAACSYEVRVPLKIFALLTMNTNYSNQLVLPSETRKYLQHLYKLVSTANLKTISNLPYRFLYSFKEVLLDALIFMLTSEKATDSEARTLMQKFVSLCAVKLSPFPVTGEDIMRHFSIAQGRKLGQLLEAAKQLWFESECTATKQVLLLQLEQNFKS